MKNINVTKCNDCPFLYQNSEYPDSYCQLAEQGWGMGYYRRHEPAPDWCPLRKNKFYKISLKE